MGLCLGVMVGLCPGLMATRHPGVRNPTFAGGPYPVPNRPDALPSPTSHEPAPMFHVKHWAIVVAYSPGWVDRSSLTPDYRQNFFGLTH
jgi:hypothetical protein